MHKLCKRCGLPIKVNRDSSEIFEDMHWLCFHMEFEHDQYDPDEPCDDPSCPWNKISGNDIVLIYSHSNMKIESENRKAGIYMDKREIETCRMPSIKMQVTLFDEYIREYQDEVWFFKEALESFCNQLLSIWDNGKGEAVLKAMSEDKFSLRVFSIDSVGHIQVEYHVNSYKYVNTFKVPYSYANGFLLEFSKIEKALSQLKHLLGEF